MILAHEYRLYLTEEEKQIIAQASYCSKVVYNLAVDANEQATAIYKECTEKQIPVPVEGKVVSWQSMSNRITQLKRTEEYSFLADASQNAQSNALKNFGTAQKNYFESLSGKRKGEKIKRPVAKKLNNGVIKVNYSAGGKDIVYRNGKLKLPGLKDSLNIHWHRPLPADAKIKTATIKSNLHNKYYISICFETNIEFEKERNGECIGIDLGIKDYITTSNGEVYNLPSKLKKLYKKVSGLSKKVKKSKDGSRKQKKYKKSRKSVYNRIGRIKDAFMHEVSAKIVKENDTICMESLAVKELLIKGKKKQSKSAHKQAWGKLIGMFKYKAEKFKVDFVQVGQYYASSQICNNCRFKNKELKKLSIRQYICPCCGANNDRDKNAADNILDEGIRILSSKSGHGVVSGHSPT